jgi:hypothetical protein
LPARELTSSAPTFIIDILFTVGFTAVMFFYSAVVTSSAVSLYCSRVGRPLKCPTTTAQTAKAAQKAARLSSSGGYDRKVAVIKSEWRVWARAATELAPHKRATYKLIR